jgi:PAS domain S-box-containing protein
LFNRQRALYIFASIFAFSLIASLITDLVKIRELQEIQKRDAKVSLVWFMNQADRESRTFLQNVSYFYIENSDTAYQEMLTSFDILWSRYDMELNGQMEVLIHSIKTGPELLKSTTHMLKVLDPLVQNLRIGDKESFDEINDLISDHLYRSYFLAINAMQVRQSTRNQRLNTINGLYIYLLVTLLAILLGGGFMIAFFFKRGKALKTQNQVFEQRVQERTEQLRQSNESLVMEAQVRQKTDQKAQQLISAINQSKEIVFILNSDNEFVFFNQSFLNLSGELNTNIEIGSAFEEYLEQFTDTQTGLSGFDDIQQWRNDWIRGLSATKRFFEVSFTSNKQFIFNIDRLDDGSVISIGADISALKQAQVALAVSERRFRNFALIGADWYWEMDADLTVTFLAGGVKTVSGLGPDFFIGKGRDQGYGIQGSGNRKVLDKFLKMADERQVFHEYETKWKRSNDVLITISLSGEPRFNKDGEFIGYIGAGRDVTERCIVEERDKRLLTAVNSLNLMVAIFDNEDNLVFYNQEYEEFLNCLDEKLGLGANFNKLWRYSCDYYAKNSDFDAEYWYDLRLSVHREPVNNFVLPIGSDQYLNVFEQMLDDGGVIIVTTDISSSKKAEQEIHRLRNYLANIIDSMSSVLIAVDANYRVIQWNIAAERETGISLKDAYQRNVIEVFHRLESEMESIIDAVTQERETSQLKRLYVKEGNTFYEDIIIYPLTTGEEAGAVIRLDNVTDQVMISEMMIQSEKMLSVGGLAAGMAHEINNPLAGMMQTANVMHNRLSNQKVIKANIEAAQASGIDLNALESYMNQRGILSMLENVIESGKRVALIVENMLDFSRQNSASSREHDLTSLLDKSVELSSTDYNLKYDYDFRNLTIVREYQDGLPPVICEAGKIQQVFLNILRNAAQAMQESCVANPTLVFKVYYVEDLDHVVVEIEDNGPGIEDEVKRRIFEPFYSTKNEGLGTGLGLSVSYFIINENHGGQLSVDSIVGKCTKFSVSLPRMGKNV